MAANHKYELLLGAAPDALTIDHINDLVDSAIREDTDLDFKETLYGNGDSEKRDLAGDVAALANTTGGVIILGITDTDGAATAAPGVELSDAEELRMQQILAGHTAPRCSVNIHRVEAAPAHGYYVLEVTRSTDAPHAVRVGDGLRYPRRHGTGIRWLTESEVADAYKNRFTTARAQIDALDTAEREGTKNLRTHNWAPDRAWLIITLVPDTPGDLTITTQLPGQVAADLRTRSAQFGHTGNFLMEESQPQGTTGLRRVIATQGAYNEREPDSLWELHTNGTGFAAVPIGHWLWGHDGQVIEPRRHVINDEDLVIRTAITIHALADHATNRCAATGLAAIRTRLGTSPEGQPTYPMQLTWPRGGTMSHFNQRDAPAHNGPPALEHTIDPAAVLAIGPDLAVTTRLIVNEIGQALGRPECWQITPDGRIRTKYFSEQRWQRQVAHWVHNAGLETTDEILG